MKKIFTGMLLLWLSSLPCQVLAEEQAITARPTELKTQPFNDAATILTLAASARVEVLNRKASWMQISAQGNTGWVKMLSLRFQNASVAAKSNGNSLKALYNLATTGSSGSTVSTDARGLDEAKLANPSANPQAFDSMRNFAQNKRDAEKFAAAEKLTTQRLGYLPAPGDKP